MSGLEGHFRLARKDFVLDARIAAPATGVTGLFGPSGSGKTTLLRLIAGLERPDKGWLTLADIKWQDDGRFLRPHRRPIGYVFQDARLFTHLDVAGNLAFAEKRAGLSPIGVTWEEIVSLLGLAPFLDRPVGSLSGGEKQRVAIARALLSQPRLLLMDEPLAGLDRDTKREILPYLERLARRLSIPVLYVSHDITEIERLADHLVLMESGQVRATGTMAEIASDPDLPLARDPDAAALIDAVIDGYDERHGLTVCRVGPHAILLPGDTGMPGETRRLRVRAGDVSLTLERVEKTSILNILPCRIAELTEIGNGQMIAVLRLEDTEVRLLARVSTKSFETLMLIPNLEVYAQIKGMALIDP